MNDLNLIDLLKIQQYKSINLNLDSIDDYTHKIGFDNRQLNGLYLFNPMVKCDDPFFLTMKKHVEMPPNSWWKSIDHSNAWMLAMC